MKAVRGYKKSDYKKMSPKVLEFETVQAAAEYLAKKHGEPTESMVRSIKNDTNCDAIYFDDDSCLLLEF